MVILISYENRNLFHPLTFKNHVKFWQQKQSKPIERTNRPTKFYILLPSMTTFWAGIFVTNYEMEIIVNILLEVRIRNKS